MAGLQTYIRPVLLLMSAVETSMLHLGNIMWYQTKLSLQEMYSGIQSRAAGAYQDARRRASVVYEDMQEMAGGTYSVVQSRTSETCQQFFNRVNLVYIQCQLKVNLALHRCQLQLSLAYKDTKAWLGQRAQQHLGVHLKNAQQKVLLMHKWTKIKVTRWKKAAAETAKVNLERMSLKAREYEDVLDQKLRKLSRSPSTKKLQAREDSQPVVPPRKKGRDRSSSIASSVSVSSQGSNRSNRSSSGSVEGVGEGGGEGGCRKRCKQ